MPHLFGIDGGGTGCRAAVADLAGRIVGRGKSGAANIMTDPDRALDNILAAAHAACDDAGLPPATITESSAVLGLAGANIGDFGARIQARLPFREADIESDALTALHGALGEGDGAVAIIGTGSVFIARQADEIRTAGGWGFMIGDLASGARLGRALLEETLLAHDGVHEGSQLTREVLERFEGNPQKLVEFAAKAKPGEFAAFASLAFDHAARGDPAGRSLVESGVRSIEEALDAIMPPGCERLSLLGGLAGRYRDNLGARYHAALHDPLGDALDGAVALAGQRFRRTEAAGG